MYVNLHVCVRVCVSVSSVCLWWKVHVCNQYSNLYINIVCLILKFNKFMTIIKDMLNKIQEDHKEFLEQNEKMQEQMR